MCFYCIGLLALRHLHSDLNMDSMFNTLLLHVYNLLIGNNQKYTVVLTYVLMLIKRLVLCMDLIN